MTNGRFEPGDIVSFPAPTLNREGDTLPGIVFARFMRYCRAYDGDTEEMCDLQLLCSKLPLSHTPVEGLTFVMHARDYKEMCEAA